MRCAACSAELILPGQLDNRTRSAREILERWSQSSAFDSFGPVGKQAAAAGKSPAQTLTSAEKSTSEKSSSGSSPAATSSQTAKPLTAVDNLHTAEYSPGKSKPENTVTSRSNPPTSDDQFAPLTPPAAQSAAASQSAPSGKQKTKKQITRIDAGEPAEAQKLKRGRGRISESLEAGHAPSPETVAAASDAGRKKLRFEGPESVDEVSDTSGSRSRTGRPPKIRQFHDAESEKIRAPHFAMRAPVKNTNWTMIAGQWLAYIGVLGLTIGTAIVVYGHFGGYANYTPTGWLITTVGQMLLFLGVINLVSGGMEQSSDEVSQRIEILGEHILRIEQSAEQTLRGPRIPVERYADSGAGADDGAESAMTSQRGSNRSRVLLGPSAGEVESP